MSLLWPHFLYNRPIHLTLQHPSCNLCAFCTLFTFSLPLEVMSVLYRLCPLGNTKKEPNKSTQQFSHTCPFAWARTHTSTVPHRCPATAWPRLMRSLAFCPEYPRTLSRLGWQDRSPESVTGNRCSPLPENHWTDCFKFESTLFFTAPHLCKYNQRATVIIKRTFWTHIPHSTGRTKATASSQRDCVPKHCVNILRILTAQFHWNSDSWVIGSEPTSPVSSHPSAKLRCLS